MLSLLLQGNIDDFLAIAWENMKKEKETEGEVRDREIARNINEAEERIRARYTQLAHRQPLRFTVFAGLLHTPERYVTIPHNVCTLVGKPSTIEERLVYAEIEGKSFDEMKLLELQFGAFNLSRIGRIPLTASQIEAMSFDELSRAIKEHARRK